MALPIGLFGLVPVTVPLRRGRALVMHPEKSGGEPPLDGPANRSAAAPAVDIAAALAVPRVVDALDQSPGHSVESRSLAGWQRNPSSRSGRRSLHRTLRWLESARRAGLPSTTSSRSIASGVRLGRERVLAKRDVSGLLGWTWGDRIRGPVWGRNSPRASGALAVSADGPDASAAEQRHRGDDHPRVAQPTSDDTEGTGCDQHRPGTANHRDQGKPGSEGSPDGPESSGRPGDSCPSLFVSSILLGMRRWTARGAGGGQQQCLFARASIVGATPESTWSSMVAARSFASR